MRGSAAFRTSVTSGGALAGPWVRNPLWAAARAVPSLDLRFAENKSLVDATTGQNLVTFTRASSGTYVDSQGVIRTATTNLLTHSQELNNATSWVLRNTGTGLLPVVTANADIAPDGTLTADRVVFSLSGAGRSDLYHNTFSAAGIEYTTSIWFRSATGSNQTIYFRTQANVISITVTPTWQRFSGGGTTSDQLQFGLRDIYTSSVTSADIYVWGAQLEQSSTVGEYIPTTSTINSAPRFDHNPTTGESLGLLVEESRTNLCLQSEDFSTTWGSTNYTVTTNATTAPNGTITADKLIRNTTDVTTSVTQNVTVTANTAYNYSVFVKASEWSKVGLREGSVSGSYVTFDLSDGTIVSSSVATGTITAFANGWYRISMQMATGGTQTTYGVRLIPLPNSYTSGTPSYSFAGDGASGLFAWGAQLEAGAFPTSYIPTTTATATRSADVASISERNFGTFRTNLLLRSEEFGTSWTRFGTTSLTENTSVAPNGTTTGDNIVFTSASSGIYQAVSGSASTTYVFSVWIKSSTSTQVRVVINTNLSDPVIQTVTVTSQWQRFSVTKTTSVGTNSVTAQIQDSGSGGTQFDLWGAQLETGSTATAYIPTTTATATVFESPWYRQDSGSWYCSANSLVFDSSERGLFAIDTGNFARGYHASTNSPTRIRTRRRDATNSLAIDATSSAETSARVALVATSTEHATTYNGGNIQTNATALTLDPITVLRIGFQNITGTAASLYLCGCISRLTYFPIRLANETLQQITQ